MSLNKPIALDAMGGDHAPASVLDGAELAAQRYPWLQFLLFGDQAKIAPHLPRCPNLSQRLTLVHTDQVVAASDKPSIALRQGRNSSMRMAIDAVEAGDAFAVVSAGNTGALMAMSKFVLKTLPGINRPAIAGLMPTKHAACVMLDLGANVMCDAEDLLQFAVMGDAFARVVLNISNPRIGLLNIGSEEVKGHEEVKAAAQLIRESELGLNFIGFVEGDDIAAGTADVIVTDGFTGNVSLKTVEGTAKMITHALKNAFGSNLLAMLGYALAHRALGKMREHFDPRKHNGAMFLGLNGIAVKSHGSADGFGFYNAVVKAVELATHRINERILQEIQYSDAPRVESLPQSAGAGALQVDPAIKPPVVEVPS